MTESKRYLVSGKVQGVGFRYFAQRAAQHAGVSGWVRNLDDGRVEAVACGPARRIDEFEQALRQGPRAADVADVSVSPATVSDTGSFVISD
ncbi:MAG TPA: acylphosphatase [Candidatus Stackebrandtia faecavium]|nr:acylphosphatase [Candidatus Stackebrandtia faecavium]